jgi:hypothetical protein
VRGECGAFGGRLRLLGDGDLDLGRDLAGDLDLDLALPEDLEGLGEGDLAVVDGVALGRERLGDVARRDRAEELVALADLALDGDRLAVQAGGDALGVLARLDRATFLRVARLASPWGMR